MSIFWIGFLDLFLDVVFYQTRTDIGVTLVVEFQSSRSCNLQIR